MKLRTIKKKSHQIVGKCWRCGAPVHNLVSRPDYKGSCLKCDEDMYSFEIENYHRHGTPVNMSRIRLNQYHSLPNW